MCLGAQKNRLIQTVLFLVHTTYVLVEKKVSYTLLSWGLLGAYKIVNVGRNFTPL